MICALHCMLHRNYLSIGELKIARRVNVLSSIQGSIFLHIFIYKQRMNNSTYN